METCGRPLREVAAGRTAGGHAFFAAGENRRTGDRGDERLVGADVRCSFVFTNMLFAGGHHHDDTIASGIVLGLTDETSRGFAYFVLLLGVMTDGKDAKSGSAKISTDSQVLAFADNDVGPFAAVLSGRF